MDFSSVVSDFVVTIVAGVTFTFILFLAKERIFPIPRLAGVWEVETITSTAIREEFNGMVLWYRVILSQSGTQISGTAEKVAEKAIGSPKTPYRGVDRIRSNLDGSIQKNYLSDSVISLHMIEDGKLRTTSAYFRLMCKRDGTLQGTWQSTAADSSGEATWTKTS